VEARLHNDHRIGVLVNNAGTAPAGGFVDQSQDDVARIVSFNAMAPVRLASAVAARFAQAGEGAIGAPGGNPDRDLGTRR
jgi:short-subunit dehydrogenase